jgi:hypothetical protein
MSAYIVDPSNKPPEIYIKEEREREAGPPLNNNTRIKREVTLDNLMCPHIERRPLTL